MGHEMLVGTVSSQKATCGMCGWDAMFGTTEMARKALLEHLKDDHQRVLITQTEGRAKFGQPWIKFTGVKWNMPESDK